MHLSNIPNFKQTATPANICGSSRRLEGVLRTSWKRLGRSKVVTLKTSLRCLETKKCLLAISVSNKSKSLSDKAISHESLSHKSKANPRCIKGTLMQI